MGPAASASCYGWSGPRATSRKFLNNYPFAEGDTLVVYSHGGLNAAGIDASLYARERGVKVVAVTSVQNLDVNQATHSSGKRLAEVADIVIDNGCEPRDAVVEVEGWGPPVGATSTLSVVVISMALVCEVAAQLALRGIVLPTFVSPNDTRFGPDHNAGVFAEYKRRTRRWDDPVMGVDDDVDPADETDVALSLPRASGFERPLRRSRPGSRLDPRPAEAMAGSTHRERR